LFTTVMAVALLGERIRVRRVAALIVGFSGVLVIVRPGTIGLDAGPLLVLGSAAFWGATMVVIKTLTRTDSSLTVTLYTGVFMTPFSFLFAVFVWEMPDARALAWLLAIGASGSLGQLALAQAFREADVTAVLPLDFLKLIWAADLDRRRHHLRLRLLHRRSRTRPRGHIDAHGRARQRPRRLTALSPS
jgi:drug/metabolite transporter (DMT)-like permease